MKPKQFDELIREKLEAMPVNVTESAIADTLRHVRGNTGRMRFFKRRNLLWMASGVLMLTLLLINWNQHQENALLQKQLDSLSTKQNELAQQLYNQRNEPLAGETVDRENASPSVPAESHQSVSANPPSASKQNGNNTTHRNTLPAQHAPENTDNAVVVPPASPSVSTEPQSINADSLQQVITDSLVSASREETALSDSAATEEASAVSNPKLRNNPVHSKVAVNAGLDFSFNPHISGNGAFVSLNYKNGLGIYTGANFVIAGGGHFDNDMEYHRDKGRDFRHTYTPLLPDTARIADIHTRYSLVQVPLRLEYALPLKNNYSITFGAGTAFDMSVRERVEFKHTDPARYEVQNKNNSAIPHALISSAQAMVGLHKEFRYWGLQGNLLLNAYMPGTPYTQGPDKLNLLGDVRVYYRLVK